MQGWLLFCLLWEFMGSKACLSDSIGNLLGKRVVIYMAFLFYTETMLRKDIKPIKNKLTYVGFCGIINL